MDSKFNALIKNYSNIAADIETNANQLEEVYSKQPSAAAYNAVYQSCVDSLSNLLKHTETLCLETTNLLNVHGESVQKLSDDVCELLLEVKLYRELGNRKVIGERTIVKQKPHTLNVEIPNEPYVINKVINTSLDISRYDGVGHGATHSSKVPAARTATVELHVPSSIKSTIFKELNELDIDANCESSFWRTNDTVAVSAPTNLPTLNVPPTSGRPSSSNKGTRQKSASAHKGTLLIKKNSTFRKRNSLTIKASAPNDISEDIYNNMLTTKTYQNSLSVGNTDSFEEDLFTGSASGLSLNVRKYDDYNTSETHYSSATSRGISSIHEEPTIDSQNAFDEDNPLKFPTPKAQTNSDSTASVPPPPNASSTTSIATPPPPPAPTKATQSTFLYKARVLYAYEKTLEDELTIEVDNIVEVLEEGDDGWFVAKLGANVGSIPGNYLQKI